MGADAADARLSGDSDSGGDVTMTTQAEELLGAQVIGADGMVVGTVEQVFRDDVDGTPAWARVRSGKTGRFVPLGTSQVTKDGLSVPFDSQKIMGGPNIDAGQHMSAAQAEELSRYYGLNVPTQPQQGQPEDTQPQAAQQPSQQPAMTGDDWLVRQEERLQVGKEMLETGHVRLHKYVDVEPIEQTVHVFHEEYDVERIPITADEGIRGNIQEGEQEIILHEERAVMRKEVVPVERVRLLARRVEEDKTYRDEIRRERIEIEPDQQFNTSGIRSEGSMRSQSMGSGGGPGNS
jgi:uncharacterized protein (TIGR02271 family)